MESLINQGSLEFPDSPDDLTNTYIQGMGTEYMEKAKQIDKKNFIVKLFSAYINQPAAQKLINYKKQSQPNEKWEFLADLYKELKCHDEKLAIDIRTLFQSVFQCNILIKIKCHENHSAYLSMKDVSDSLKGISSRYFLKHYIELYNALDNSYQRKDSSPSSQDLSLITYP